jgi:cell division protease FtsH
LTPGFTGADIANLVNEAALLAARRDKTRVGMVDFQDAIDRVIAGPERKSRVLNDKDKKVVAYHEIGHAIVGELLLHADPVHKVSILPRGMALGYTISLPEEDKYNISRSEIEDKIAMALGGRVAEELVFQEMTTGASNDLDRSTDMARAMVCEYGMSERLGPLRLGRRHGNPFLGRDLMEDRDYSEEVAQAIDEEVRSIMERNYNRAKDLLVTNREMMDKIVEVLIQKETIERAEFLALMAGNAVSTPPEIPTAPPPDTGTPISDPEPQRPRLEPRFRPEPGPA